MIYRLLLLIVLFLGCTPGTFTKYQVYTLAGDTFDLDVTVLITDDVAFATKYVRENLDSTVTSSDFDARAVSFPTVEGRSPIIWMATTDDQGVIAHEIFHTALNIMYWAGMDLNSETEEAFAYEVQHLTNSFYNQINKIQ
tara:strand:+ start:587 stop:1006 length:420 start_codon:yes stop_codon:yes gene_type:complete